MAKIIIKNHEIQLKAIKRTNGREGHGFIANIYMDNKKIGTYVDYADGGVGSYEFISRDTEQAFMEALVEYAKTYPNKYIIKMYERTPRMYEEDLRRFKKIHPYIPEADITKEIVAGMNMDDFMSRLFILNEKEKLFKRLSKKGYVTVVTDKNCCSYIAYPAGYDENLIEADMQKDNLAEKYASLADFAIRITQKRIARAKKNRYMQKF